MSEHITGADDAAEFMRRAYAYAKKHHKKYDSGPKRPKDAEDSRREFMTLRGAKTQ